MIRRIAVLAAVASLLLPLSVRAATPNIVGESQAWYRRAGIQVPANVGFHTHVGFSVPAFVSKGTTLSIPLHVIDHRTLAATNWIRIQKVTPSGSIVEVWKRTLVLGPCTDCSADLTASISTAGWATGRHELRISANTPDAEPSVSGAQRMFQSTGIQVCVDACTPSYRSGPYLEARGWYTDHGYANARLTSPLDSLVSGGTIKVSLKPGSGGDPTTFAGVYIDPAFHDGSAGTVVRTWNGPFSGSVTLPRLSSGTHKLVLLSSDGQNAGVLALPLVVP